MDTKKAFQKLLDSPELIKKLEVDMNVIYRWRRRLKENNLSIGFMEEKLLKAGVKKIPEKWVF